MKKKEKIFTMSDFAHMSSEEKEKEIPIKWIGQGYGYKSSRNWEDMEMDEMIYIPEYMIENGTPINAYSKKEFVKICKGDEAYAKYLFEYCDWQSPWVAYDEIEANDLYLKPDNIAGEEKIIIIKDLKKIINNLPDDMPIFIGCEGYCDNAIRVIEHNGTLIIKDDGVIEMGECTVF